MSTRFDPASLLPPQITHDESFMAASSAVRTHTGRRLNKFFCAATFFVQRERKRYNNIKVITSSSYSALDVVDSAICCGALGESALCATLTVESGVDDRLGAETRVDCPALRFALYVKIVFVCLFVCLFVFVMTMKQTKQTETNRNKLI